LFDIEKFNGKIKFGLKKIQINDLPIQLGLHKVWWKCGKFRHVKRNCSGGAISKNKVSL
jgi:hypothetical protein